MSHEVDWARVGKMPIKELSLSWLISAGESKSRIQWILLTKKRHGIFWSENTKVQRVIWGQIWVKFFTHTFLRRLRKSSSGVGTIDWRLKYEKWVIRMIQKSLLYKSIL